MIGSQGLDAQDYQPVKREQAEEEGGKNLIQNRNEIV
jgi:hypothetical protein